MYRSHRGGVTQERGNSNALMTGDQSKVTSPLLKEKATQLLVYVRDKNKSQRQTTVIKTQSDVHRKPNYQLFNRTYILFTKLANGLVLTTPAKCPSL